MGQRLELQLGAGARMALVRQPETTDYNYLANIALAEQAKFEFNITKMHIESIYLGGQFILSYRLNFIVYQWF